MSSVDRYNIEAVRGNGTEVYKSSDGYWVCYTDHVAALAAEREKVAEKFKAFADEKGEPRKVNGTLIYTDEGDILSHGGKLFQILTHSREWGSIGLCQVKLMEWDEWDSDEDLKANAPRGYSTKAAAEAAKADPQSLDELLELPIDGETAEQTAARVADMKAAKAARGGGN